METTTSSSFASEPLTLETLLDAIASLPKLEPQAMLVSDSLKGKILEWIPQDYRKLSGLSSVAVSFYGIVILAISDEAAEAITMGTDVILYGPEEAVLEIYDLANRRRYLAATMKLWNVMKLET